MDPFPVKQCTRYLVSIISRYLVSTISSICVAAGGDLLLPALRADHGQADGARDGVQEPQEDGRGRTLRWTQKIS